MANDSTIDGLPLVSALTEETEFPVSQDGTAKKANFGQMIGGSFLPMDLLPSGTDFNDVIAPGCYLVAGASSFTYSNNPISGHAGILLVYRASANYGMQVIYDINSASPKVIFKRSRNSSSSFLGSVWHQITGEPVLRILKNDYSYTSCNDVRESCVIFLSVSGGSSPQISDFPFEERGWLVTYDTHSTNVRAQKAIRYSDGYELHRVCKADGTWSQWTGEDKDEKGLKYWMIHESHDSSNPASPSDMPVNSYFYSGGFRLGDGWFGELDASKFYFVYCYASNYNPVIRHYQAFESRSGKVFEGYTTNSGTTVTWARASGGGSAGSGKTLKVLSIGSSFGQDCTVYAPWLIEEMDSSVSVISGIVYMSGGSIDRFNAWFDNDTALNYYKREEGADAWASGVQKTLKQVLDDEEWDIILVNQSAANGGDWTTFSNLEAYLEKIVTYIGHPVKLGYLMPQVALGASNPYTYSDLIDCAQKAFNGSIVSFVIPSGTAIENARNTSLNSIGDRPGGLSADELGHLQEGLPVLIANYVTAAKLLEVTQGGIDKIMGCTLFPTAAWVAGHNIPGQNGTSTGVTAANILLGQRCAVQAVKKPYEVSV